MLLSLPSSTCFFTECLVLMAISPNPQGVQPKILNPAKNGRKLPYFPAVTSVPTPKQGQASAKPDIAEPNKVASSKTGWMLLGGVLVLTSLFVGFFNRNKLLGWFEKVKTPAIVSSKPTEKVHPTPPNITPTAETIHPASPKLNPFKPKRSLNTVKAFCEAVMQEGNGDMACQTMAFFNSLRLFSKLAETEPGFSGTIDTARIKKILGTQSNEALKTKASQGIDLLIFDQLKCKENAFERLPLFELLRQDRDNGVWCIRLYDNESDNSGIQWDNAFEKQFIERTGTLWEDITTDNFHQKLMTTGDQFFMPNNP
jgi:hypothetical protein